jgi:hypothetical protein
VKEEENPTTENIVDPNSDQNVVTTVQKQLENIKEAEDEHFDG